MTKPGALVVAEIIDGLCQRWGQPPSVIVKEDAAYVMQMMAVIAEGTPEKADG